LVFEREAFFFCSFSIREKQEEKKGRKLVFVFTTIKNNDEMRKVQLIFIKEIVI
jgi:hypothetical protein